MNRFAVVLVVIVLGTTGCPEKPAPAPAPTPAPAPAPVAPLVPKKEIADWCPEHGVPESVCTRCNAPLVAEFKKKNDWCAKHELPDTQCLTCHPEHAAKWKAMAPKAERK